MSTDTELVTVMIDENAILRHLGLNPQDAAAQALVVVCRRYQLDPILKHAVLIKGNLYVTRDGLLHVAHRGGKLDGIEVLEQGENATHFIAKVSVHRKDMSHPFTYVGRYPKNGSNKNYGPEMAVKVGEVMALRRAFDVSLAAREEMWDQIEEAGAPPQGSPSQPVAKTALPPQESGGQSYTHPAAPSDSTSPESGGVQPSSPSTSARQETPPPGSGSSWQKISAAVTSPHSKLSKNRVLHVAAGILIKRGDMPKQNLEYHHVANLPEDVLSEVVKRLELDK